MIKFHYINFIVIHLNKMNIVLVIKIFSLINVLLHLLKMNKINYFKLIGKVSNYLNWVYKVLKAIEMKINLNKEVKKVNLIYLKFQKKKQQGKQY